MPVDPVCGIEMDEELATIHEYNGKKYYFCCEGCKSIFSRKPGKYSKKQNIVPIKLLYELVSLVITN